MSLYGAFKYKISCNSENNGCRVYNSIDKFKLFCRLKNTKKDIQDEQRIFSLVWIISNYLKEKILKLRRYASHASYEQKEKIISTQRYQKNRTV
jgi:hypothetical protein